MLDQPHCISLYRSHPTCSPFYLRFELHISGELIDFFLQVFLLNTSQCDKHGQVDP